MTTIKSSSTSKFKRVLQFGQVILAGMIMLAMAASAQGQAPTPKADPSAKKKHWRKYVNREYGFSFWYPVTYGPMKPNELCKDNDYRRYLFCLEGSDDPEAAIYVTIIIGSPFQIEPWGPTDAMPRRRVIGEHIFYSGTAGRLGFGFEDKYVLDLKGRTVEFGFLEGDGEVLSAQTKALEITMLKTFRTF
jgi:hypothetical protein